MIIIKINSGTRHVLKVILVLVLFTIGINQFILYNYTFKLAFKNTETITIIGKEGNKEIKDKKIIETFIDKIVYKISMRREDNYQDIKNKELYYLDFQLDNSESILIAYDKKNKILLAKLSKLLNKKEYSVYDEFIENNYLK
ncbi:MAG: hypothetical protein FH751_16615 [Firmicutes bacterium]|nr:hypothetical protein [Bacillota bacterium]